MAERSFSKEVLKLRARAGEIVEAEGILAVAKALLESGVAYVGGYQGAPISHLMDVLSDAQDILLELGVHFESSASEATAAAMLSASINYPLRGAVTWKSTVGTNVASDALANLASGGVTGGALIIVGEDYGEGSSIIQERTHAFAMKSQIWLLDPRPNLPSIVDMVAKGFELSEASNTPVMLELRVRACHVLGRFTASDNKSPVYTLREALEQPQRRVDRIALPPSVFVHEQEKIQSRWPAAIRFIQERKLNEFFGEASGEIGIIVQGGLYNSLMRALHLLGVADIYGETAIPVYVLNVTYPLVDAEVVGFCSQKRAVLLVEEGQPDYIEQAIATILRRAHIATALAGKDLLPRAGEYDGVVLKESLTRFFQLHAPALVPIDIRVERSTAVSVPDRPPGFCTGCPERPVFAAMKLLEREMGAFNVSCDIGCHLFSILPPFNIGNSTMGYGLGAAGMAALNVEADKRAIAIMGDGGFWHNGLTSGIANAVYNRSDNVTVIIDNGYAAATGGQHVLSSKAPAPARSTYHKIQDAVRGVGIRWLRTVKTYDVAKVRDTLREALTTREPGPKVIIAESECQLSRQRRIKPIERKAIANGERVIKVKFGVDPETCTGDHSCIRLSGCPALTIRDNPDPLREDPVAHVDNGCVGCGLCGEISHAAVLCPSFYRAELIHNPNRRDRWMAKIRAPFIGFLQRRAERRRTMAA
jgi:indolepyruvate ferredoxin oxidoreductase, alpha subunit